MSIAGDWPNPYLLGQISSLQGNAVPLPIVLVLGVLLVASLISGRVAATMHLPTVTAFLLVGIVLSPNMTPMLPDWLSNTFIGGGLIRVQQSVGYHVHEIHPIF